MKVRQRSQGRWALAAISIGASLVAHAAMAAGPVRGVTASWLKLGPLPLQQPKVLARVPELSDYHQSVGSLGVPGIESNTMRRAHPFNITLIP